MGTQGQRVLCGFAGVLLAFALPSVMHAQAVPTESHAFDVSMFAGGSYLRPNYGGQNQFAFFLGGDFTFHIPKIYVDPSLEVRGSVTPNGPAVNEDVYGGGLKLEHAFGRFHPYGDGLVGAGTLQYRSVPTFTPYARSDNSIVLTYGGGADIDLAPHLRVKVEYEGSHWNLGYNTKLNPQMVDAGLVFHFQ